MYYNGVIYNFTYNKSAKLLDVSQATAHKQITRMIAYGLAELQPCGNLKLSGVNALKERENELTIPVPVETSKKRQIAQLRYVLVHRNLNRQKFVSKKKGKIVTKATSIYQPITIKELRFRRKVEKKQGKSFESTYQREVTLSNNRFGKILNRSMNSGKAYQKQFNEMGLIKSEPRYTALMFKQTVDSLYRVKYEENCYYLKIRKGVILKQLSNTIIASVFNESYTVALK